MNLVNYKFYFIKNIFNFTLTFAKRHKKSNLLFARLQSSVDIKGTVLQSRFLEYFSNKNKLKLTGDNILNKKINIKEILHRNIDLKHYNNTELSNILCVIASEKDKTNSEYFKTAINFMNNESTLRFNQMDNTEILTLLNAFMYAYPEKAVELSFYNKAIKKLCTELPILRKEDVIQLCFYLGQKKKDDSAQNCLKKCLERLELHLPKMLVDEICIISSSFFKTSTKIKNSIFLSLISQKIKSNLQLLNDSAYFVTFVKIMRHNKYYDYRLLEIISTQFENNNFLKYYTFTAVSHLLALYADSLYYAPNVMRLFVAKCVEEIKISKETNHNKKEHFSKYIRTKDIGRFLWALSALGYADFEAVIINDIIPHLYKRLNNGEFRNENIMLLDIVLALWILDIKDTVLLKQLLLSNNVKDIYESCKIRDISRLDLLLLIVRSEEPQLFKELQNEAISNLYQNIGRKWWNKKRKSCSLIHNELKKLSTELNFEKIVYENQIPVINISGFSVYNRTGEKISNVEFLDDDVCLKNTNKDVLCGLMKLKLRLFESIKEPSIVVPQRLLKRREKLPEFFRSQFQYLINK